MQDLYLQEQVHNTYPLVQAIRHYIHTHPELSFEEHNTAAFVSQKLSEWGITHTTGIAGTGIVALLRGMNPDSKCLALRAELDALPIQELNTIHYRSQNEGIMHACGHDVHTSCLLGTSKILNDLRNEWEGTIKIIFQPGEEKHPGGASLLIKAGVLENPRPSAIFALHVYPHLPSGTVGFRAGQYMAATDEIYITIEGKGGHAALPHQTVDPIATAAQVITALQQVVSRKGNPVSPTVLTFGKIQGGFVNNVIPDQVKIDGTLRTMNESWRFKAHQLIKDIVHHTCAMYGAEGKVEIPTGYPSLYNDEVLTEKAEKWTQALLGAEHVKKLDLRMAGEDFSFYTHEIPGCFYRIGTNLNNEHFTAPVHNAHFDIHEPAMKTAMATMVNIALNYLQEKE